MLAAQRPFEAQARNGKFVPIFVRRTGGNPPDCSLPAHTHMAMPPPTGRQGVHPPTGRSSRKEDKTGHSEFDPAARERRPWNAGRMVGAKRALKPQ